MKRTDIKKRPLSDSVVKKLQPESREYREHDSNNLYLRVAPNGAKTWLYRYKQTNGRWSALGLGKYPQVTPLQARKKAMQLAEKIAKGEPLQTQRQIKQALNGQNKATFETIALDWLDSKKNHWKGGKDGKYKEHKKALERHIFPVFSKRNYKDIKPKEWLAFFENIQTKGTYSLCEILVQHCTAIYRRAKFQGLIDYNPLEGITRELKPYQRQHMSFIDPKELPQLIKDIRSYPNRVISIMLELQLLLFPRPCELRLATWEQIDFDNKVWHKPAEVMKTGKPHAVPLSSQVMGLLKELKTYQSSQFIANGFNGADKPLADTTLRFAMVRLGYGGKQTLHGFRHLASTVLNNQFSERAQVIEACLAHNKRGVKGVYDKSTHFEERKHIMQWWADYINQFGE